MLTYMNIAKKKRKTKKHEDIDNIKKVTCHLRSSTEGFGRTVSVENRPCCFEMVTTV